MEEKNVALKKIARISGFLFLWLIITGLTGALITSNITGSGTFPEKVERIVASEKLYRVALLSSLIETMSALLLGFALYVLLKPVNKLLAQLAMYWRLGEAIIGSVAVIFAFARLNVYTSAQSATAPAQAEALVDLIKHAGFAFYNISALFFSIGSLLFFFLFYKSRYIPKLLGGFGVFASIVATIMCFATLTFPEYAGTIQYGWIAMAIAEVGTGVWLLTKGVNQNKWEMQKTF